MAKFHINNKGEAKECKAQPGNCPITKETGGKHYDTTEEAQSAYEKNKNKEILKTFNKNITIDFDNIKTITEPTSWIRILENYKIFSNEISEMIKEIDSNLNRNNDLIDYDEYFNDLYEDNSVSHYEGLINLSAMHSVDVKIGQIDASVESWFMHGNCTSLAVKMSSMIDNQIVVFEHPDNPLQNGQKWSHVAAKIKDEKIIDITGIHDIKEYESKYNATAKTYNISKSTNDSEVFKSIFKGFENIDQSMKDFYSDVELTMIDHYAKLNLINNRSELENILQNR